MWWLIAGVALADRVFTFGYFIPTMVELDERCRHAEVSRSGNMLVFSVAIT